VLAAAADGWQATARQAVLTNGWLELSGAPAWTQGDRSVQGDVLRLNTQHRAFAAHGNARLQLPATAFGTAWPGPEDPAARPPVFRTNQFVVVESAQAEFAGAWLRFAPPVRARWFEADLLLGQLDCRDLTVRYPDRLERLTAAGEVRLGQFPRPGRPPLERQIACDQLDLAFDDHGRVRELSATGGVRGQQTERLPGTPEPRLTRIEAERIEARFGRQTNQLERATAQGQVRIERDARRASGERADYSGAEGRLFLMGQPEVTSPEGSIHNATTLIWDTRRSRVSGQGPYRIEWRQGLTNVTIPRVMGSPR
jgi:lipopolysaccharide export system protein LptA